MKIRNGFVSNSSSSSFIVAFPHKPTSAEDVHAMMFGEGRDFPHPYADLHDEETVFSSQHIAETVWQDLQDKEPLTEDGILEEINGGYFPGYPHDDYRIKSPADLYAEQFREMFHLSIYDVSKTYPKEYEHFRKLQKAEWAASRERVCEAAIKCWEEHALPADHTIYALSYSDNDGSFGSFMEHGGIFENLKHIVISHH